MKLRNAAHAVEKVKDVHPVKHVAKVSRLRKLVPDSVTRAAGRSTLLASKNSPSVLFAAGVVGVVGTTVLACRATLKIDEQVLDTHEDRVSRAKSRLAEKRPDYTVKDYNRDMTLIYAKSTGRVIKLYGPSVLLGAASIAALAGSHNILTKRNAGLTAAYAAVEKSYADYRKRVVEEFGEEKDRDLRYDAKEVDVVEPHPDDPTKTQARRAKKFGPGGVSEYARLFDEHNVNWNPRPEFSWLFLIGIQNYMNDRLRTKGHVLLNDVYDALGMDRTAAGAVVGSVFDRKGDTKHGDNYIDFGIQGDKHIDRFHDFMVGAEHSILLDFNVDGTMFDKIG